MTPYADTGVFDAQATPTGDDCSFSGPLSGIATPLTVIEDKAELAIQLDTPDEWQTAVFMVTKR